MKIINLMTCGDSAEANIIKGHLQNEDIPCFLTNQNFTDLYPGLNSVMGTGIQIRIRQSDFDKAVAIIRDTYPEIYKNVSTEISCPKCSSEQYKIKYGVNAIKVFFLMILSLFTMVPVSKIPTYYLCKDCGAKF